MGEDNRYIFSVMSDMFDGLVFEDDSEEEGTQKCADEEAIALQSINTTVESEVHKEPAVVVTVLDEDVVMMRDDDYDIPSWRGVDNDCSDCDSDSDSCNSYDTDDDLYDEEEDSLMFHGNNKAGGDNTSSCATESGWNI